MMLLVVTGILGRGPHPTYDIPLYSLVDRILCNGLIIMPINWVGCHPLNIAINQGPLSLLRSVISCRRNCFWFETLSHEYSNYPKDPLTDIYGCFQKYGENPQNGW